MRVGFLCSCAFGLALAGLLSAAPAAQAQKTTSTKRIPIRKDRPTTPAPAASASSRVNQDSIAAAERARQDSIAAAATAERDRQDAVARRDQMRRDSIVVADRQRQDSIAAADAAREDSIARAHDRSRPRDRRVARNGNGGFYIGVGGGSTMPMGDLKTSANNTYYIGWNVTMPFGWDFRSVPLGLRFDLAMDNLIGNPDFLDPGGNPVASRNAAIYSASGGLKLNVPLGRTASHFYLMGGAGAHRITGYATSAVGSDSAQTIQNAKTNVGWYGGAGFNFRFGKTALFLESRYINIDTKQPIGFPYAKANYLPVVLGFQF